MGEECLGALTSILEENEQWLMRRVLSYAQRLAYTRYTSTLEEAWRVSIQGLSRSLLAAVERGGWDLEIPVDCDLGCDGAASFGIEEARLHRSRGVTLAMFLGLMKYYRQAYLDLLGDQNLDPSVRRLFSHAVHRFFDRVEIGFCDEWQSPTDGEHVRVLEERNRRMTNEKNKYLTVFDSLRTPVLLFDSQGRIDNANALAAQLFGLSDHSGAAYYSGEGRGRVFQPLAEDVAAFTAGDTAETDVERSLATAQGTRHFLVSFKRMLDVSDKFTGFTAILTDISEHRRAEEILRALSLRDDLTGLNNRRGFLAFARRQVVLAERLGAPVRIVYMDVDNMKAINDRHGHGAGDTALRDVAGLLVESFRATDVLGRIGGDEFAALVMGDDEDLRVVERFECNLARFNRYGTRPYCLEVSTGFAEPRAAAECDIAALLDQADGRMYEDKHRRRLHGASRQATFRV